MEDKNTRRPRPSNKACMSSQRLKPQAQELHRSKPRSLGIYYCFHYSISTGFLTVWTSGSLILMPSLALSFCSFALSNFNVMIFILFNYIFFVIISSKSCLSNERQKGCGLGWEGRWGGGGKSRGKGTVIRIYYMRYFQWKGKEKIKVRSKHFYGIYWGVENVGRSIKRVLKVTRKERVSART